MKNKSICVVGSINYDVLIFQDRLPTKGETYTGNSVTFAMGGKGANQAVQCAKLGAKTEFIGAVGKDQFGKAIINNFKKYKVQTENILEKEGNTGLGIVHVLSEGDVYATIIEGANCEITEEDISNAVETITQSDIIILQMEIPIHLNEMVIRIANEAGKYVILNAAPAKEISSKALKKVDCLIVNEVEASFYSKENVETVEDAKNAAMILHKLVKDVVIITLGEKGSILYDGKEIVEITKKEAQAVDTTGAGDSYVGTFAYCLLNNMTAKASCEYASLAAARTVEKKGAQEGMPNKKTLFR